MPDEIYPRLYGQIERHDDLLAACKKYARTVDAHPDEAEHSAQELRSTLYTNAKQAARAATATDKEILFNTMQGTLVKAQMYVRHQYGDLHLQEVMPGDREEFIIANSAGMFGAEVCWTLGIPLERARDLGRMRNELTDRLRYVPPAPVPVAKPPVRIFGFTGLF